jgi:hypothetical protein
MSNKDLPNIYENSLGKMMFVNTVDGYQILPFVIFWVKNCDTTLETLYFSNLLIQYAKFGIICSPVSLTNVK